MRRSISKSCMLIYGYEYMMHDFPFKTAVGPENVRTWRLNFDGGVERALQMANNHRIEQFLYLHPPLKTAKVRATITAAHGTVYNGGMEHIWFYRAAPHNNYWGLTLT